MSILAPAHLPYIIQSPAECGIPFAELAKRLPAAPEAVYADPVPNSEEPGHSAVYRNRAAKVLKKALMPGMETYGGIWANSLQLFPNRPALAWRPYDYATQTHGAYTSATYTEVDARVRDFGSGVLYLVQHNPFAIAGHAPHDKMRAHASTYLDYDSANHSFVLTLYSGNRLEWMIADLACLLYAITNTVLYDTLGPHTSEYILGLTELPVCVTSGTHVAKILDLKQLHESLKSLVAVVSMDPMHTLPQGIEARARSLNVMLYDFETVCKVGQVFPHQKLMPRPETVYTISFTLGTTGAAPKGVVLTHEIAALGIGAVGALLPRVDNDLSFSFLPLAHIFERQMIGSTLIRGGLAAFPQLNGTPLTLVEDLKLFKPRRMANVPRVFTKFEAAVKHATLQLPLAVRRALFAKIVATKSERQLRGDNCKGEHWLYDRVFLPKIRAALGFDRMEYAVTGLAPIAPSTVKFLKAALGMGFLQGYGLTELFAGFALLAPYEKEPGLCGPNGYGVEMRVREVPLLGYMLNDPAGPSGELLLRGPQIFKEYYKNPEETAKLVNNEWFATGDVARFASGGRLYIVDRVKNFFKLAQGEYVLPERVENAYLSANPLITQAFVHGDSMLNYLVAVVGIDPVRGAQFLQKLGHLAASEQEILTHYAKLEVRRELVAELARNVKGLAGFEQIQNLYVEFEPLRVEREVVTPTIKLRRPVAAKFFKEAIDRMYDEGSLIQKAKI